MGERIAVRLLRVETTFFRTRTVTHLRGAGALGHIVVILVQGPERKLNINIFLEEFLIMLCYVHVHDKAGTFWFYGILFCDGKLWLVKLEMANIVLLEVLSREYLITCWSYPRRSCCEWDRTFYFYGISFCDGKLWLVKLEMANFVLSIRST